MKKLLLSIFLAISLFANEYTLALEWYPSICKVKHYPSCKRPLRFWMENFTLHGLWPKREYCRVDVRSKILDKRRAWKKIPLRISPTLSELLFTYMPGFSVGLHKHEWIKHGSCFSKNPDEYFLVSISLTSQINQSAIRDYFLAKRGKRVQTKQIRHIFDRLYFKGAGKKVGFVCQKGYLTELRINLAGSITPQTPLYPLLKRAKPKKLGCTIGKIAY